MGSVISQFNAIPSDLKKLHQWVVWKGERRNGKNTKVPYQICGEHAKVNDSSTWTSFEKAAKAVETFPKAGFDGIGFVFTDEDPFVGFDFDRCIQQNDAIRYDIQAILLRLKSYTEFSPSGKGLHCIVKADDITGQRNSICEIYPSSRYFTFTGLHLRGTPLDISNRENIAHEIAADTRLITRINQSKQSPKFTRLFQGDISGYPSASEADFALCAILSYWTQNRYQTDRIFRLSALLRDKWDQRHSADGSTYGQMTIARSCQDDSFNCGDGSISAVADTTLFLTRDRESHSPKPFWDISGGNCRIKQAALVDYLHAKGFSKLYPPGAASSILVRTRDKILEEVSTERIKDYVFEKIQTLENGSMVREALVRGTNVYLSRSLFECIPALDAVFHKDTENEAFFYFENGVVRATKSDVEIVPYVQLDGFVWKDSVLSRQFTPLVEFDSDPYSCEFGRFLRNATGQGNPDRLHSLSTAIGYLLHKFKDRSRAKAICFVDEAITDLPSGRAGKSLASGAIGLVVPSVRIDGRNFQFQSPFAFQDVKTGTAVVEFNDVPKNFAFARLFSVITDDMQIERKNRDRFTLSFSNSPKFVISTNYVIEGEGGSHRDRIFEIEFSAHYNERHTPADEFGHRLFADWDVEEWNRFDNLMMFCVSLYLKSGLTDYKHQNLRTRKLRQMTSHEFAEYVSDESSPIQINTRYDKKEAFEAFLEEYGDLRHEVHQRNFTKWVQIYAQVMDLKIVQSKSGASRYFILNRRS